MSTADPRHRSRDVTEGYERAPARAMLRAVGMTDEDFVKPQVGIASIALDMVLAVRCLVWLNLCAQPSSSNQTLVGAIIMMTENNTGFVA